MVGKFAIAARKLGRLSLEERLLLAFSKNPQEVDRTSDFSKPTAQWTLASALAPLKAAFPDLAALVRGRDVLDYGCGDGFQAVALAELGARRVLGVDIETARLAHGRRMAREIGVADRVEFAPRAAGQFDVVLSLNAFEHYPDPLGSLHEIRAALRPGGVFLLAFGPLWYAPYGAHMYFFCRLPWLHLLFSERAVFRIRSLYRDDGGRHYEPGLNRMSVRKFERLVAAAGLRASRRRYATVAGLPLVGRLPLLRELFVNHVAAVLEAVPEAERARSMGGAAVGQTDAALSRTSG